MALSQVARGKILTAGQRGEPIPADWAVDEQGNPTTDPAAALKGALQPIGGAKGAALAMMVEVLAVALTGAHFGFEASSFFDAEGPPPGVGQLLVAIDPGAFAGREVFLDRIGALAGMLEADAGARMPGSRRLALARQGAAATAWRWTPKLLAEARALAGDSRMTPSGLSAADVTRLLGLQPHPEGGHYRETFRDIACRTPPGAPPPRPSIFCSPPARCRAGTGSTPPRHGTGMRARRWP